MKVKIIPKISLQLEVDGERIAGTFIVESAWNGLLHLRSSAPCCSVIIQHPGVSHLNAFDSLLTLFGGNAKTDADIKSIEAEIVTRDFETRAEAAQRQRVMRERDEVTKPSTVATRHGGN